MPTVNVKKELLMQQLGQSYTDEQFDELCFQFGIELDEVAVTDHVIYKIDIPANRYDLLSLEGLVLALRIFTGKMQPPQYKVTKGNIELTVDQNRPILLAAVVRNIDFDENTFNSYLDLKDKITQNIGRKGTLLTIKTHDLDTSRDGDITARTKNVLIEVASQDRAKATIALDTIVVMLIIANGRYEAESVKIKHPDGKEFVTPDLSYHREEIDVDYINKGLGINVDAQGLVNLLIKMGIRASVLGEKQQGDTKTGLLEVFIPPTRHDIIHKCDVMEDVGIAYGYDNIVKTLPRSATISSQVPLNKISDQLRHEIARCGYTEALNFALCSKNELSVMLRRTKLNNLVEIANPKTLEFQVARTCLLPGLLKTIASNKKMPLPLKLFEISDVVCSDLQRDVGARNQRHLSAVYYGKNSGFEIVHGLLDRIMQVLEIPYIGASASRESLAKGYYLQATSDSVYFPGRCAEVIYNSQRIGYIGTLHPEVLDNFELNHPASALEIDIERVALQTQVQSQD